MSAPLRFASDQSGTQFSNTPRNFAFGTASNDFLEQQPIRVIGTYHQDHAIANRWVWENAYRFDYPLMPFKAPVDRIRAAAAAELQFIVSPK